MKTKLWFLMALLVSSTGAWADGLTTDEFGAYLIKNAADWTTFCTNVNGGNSYSGETVKLDADINSSTIVGSEDHPFKGTFDGGDHKLTIYISSNGSAALFGRVADATIQNLHVTGSVTTTMTDGADHTAGLIGKAEGAVTINNVRVSATVTGLTYYGGFIGHGEDSEQTNGIVEMRNEEGEMRNVNGEMRNDSAVWYTLDGRKVNSHLSPLTSHTSPLKKGLYINNGKKVVIK